MKSTGLLIIAALCCVDASAQIAHRVRVEDRAPDYYAWVTTLESGPITGYDAPLHPGEEGYRWRVAIVTSEIYDALHIERVTYGMEGCCVRIASTRRLDMDSFAERFQIKGEISGIEEIEWVEAAAFEFGLRGRRFRVDDLQATEVLVREI